MLSLLVLAGAAWSTSASAVGSPGRFAAPPPAQSAETFAVAAKRVLVDGKTVIEDGVVVVERGKVREVLDAKQKSKLGDLSLVEHDGWVSAGMIASRSHLGTRGDFAESKRSVAPQARIVDAIDFDHPEFEAALRAGITTVVVTPSATNLIGGQSAAIKTHGRVILDADAQLVIAPSASALRLNREPTSFPGAMAMLNAQFDKPQGAIAQVAEGKLPVMISVGARDEIGRALEFATARKLRGALSHAPLAGELAADVKKSGLAVVLGPFDVGVTPRVLDSVRALAAENVPLAFGLDFGSAPEALRFSAVMCVRSGLAPDLAWNTLTSHAAAILGLQERVGTLRAGCDADLVLWSGPPLDLTSRVQGVFVGGVHVWGGRE